jgi:hypothetical protein
VHLTQLESDPSLPLFAARPASPDILDMEEIWSAGTIVQVRDNSTVWVQYDGWYVMLMHIAHFKTRPYIGVVNR